MPEHKTYTMEECCIALRSNPVTGMSDEQVEQIFLKTLVSDQEDVDKILNEMERSRKDLFKKLSEKYRL